MGTEGVIVTVNMADFGISFATRPRAVEIAQSLGRGRDLTINWEGVSAASPSFVDEFLGALAARFDGRVAFEGLEPQLQSIFERQIAKREIGDRFLLLATV
jgi:hypothetical protein